MARTSGCVARASPPPSWKCGRGHEARGSMFGMGRSYVEFATRRRAPTLSRTDQFAHGVHRRALRARVEGSRRAWMTESMRRAFVDDDARVAMRGERGAYRVDGAHRHERIR